MLCLPSVAVVPLYSVTACLMLCTQPTPKHGMAHLVRMKERVMMAESSKRAAIAHAVETGGGISRRGEMEVITSPALRPSSS